MAGCDFAGHRDVRGGLGLRPQPCGGINLDTCPGLLLRLVETFLVKQDYIRQLYLPVERAIEGFVPETQV